MIRHQSFSCVSRVKKLLEESLDIVQTMLYKHDQQKRLQHDEHLAVTDAMDDDYTDRDAVLYSDPVDPNATNARTMWRADQQLQGKNATKGKPLLMIGDGTDSVRGVKLSIMKKDGKQQESRTAVTGSSSSASASDSAGGRYETQSRYARYLVRRQELLGLPQHEWLKSLAE
jgi:hypothetical protein